MAELGKFESAVQVDMSMSQCLTCKNFDGIESLTCAAFPEGIPIEIFGNSISHKEPVEGDDGIFYEPK